MTLLNLFREIVIYLMFPAFAEWSDILKCVFFPSFSIAVCLGIRRLERNASAIDEGFALLEKMKTAAISGNEISFYSNQEQLDAVLNSLRR